MSRNKSKKVSPVEIPEVETQSADPVINQVEAEPSVTPEPEKQSQPEKYDTAIVLDKGREVRRYTEQIHGEKFFDLAQEFAVSRKYQLKFKLVGPGITCPSCGHNFDPK